MSEAANMAQRNAVNLPCSACRWIKVETIRGKSDAIKDFATCSNAKVKGKPIRDSRTGEFYERVAFCEVERLYESGCGKVGRFFEDRATSVADKASEAGRDIQLENAVITWVEMIARGEKAR